LWPLLVLTQTKSETMASAVLGILPLLAVFLLLQRQIAQGVASTGIK
jgi:multiple sugar transport system permease protein